METVTIQPQVLMFTNDHETHQDTTPLCSGEPFTPQGWTKHGCDASSKNAWKGIEDCVDVEQLPHAEVSNVLTSQLLRLCGTCFQLTSRSVDERTQAELLRLDVSASTTGA
jgi:hypothetical protein